METMKKFDYYVKKVNPEDIKYHLKNAGNAGWELVQIIILQKTTQFTIGQMPKIEVFYEVIMKRESDNQLENGEIEQEINEHETGLKMTEEGKKDYDNRLSLGRSPINEQTNKKK
jgi:hypothetical protein